MQLGPYLNFSGNCEEALRFYEQALGGKVEVIHTYAGTPMEKHVPPEWRNKVMHASLHVGDEVLMLSDVPPDNYQKPQGFSVCLSIDHAADAERIFQALAENGTLQMPIQQTFWAHRFGMTIDRFGIPWIVNCEKAA